MANNLPDETKRTKALCGVLAALAGGPNVWRQNRRGSFLILVVGTLALLAVITIVYVTIGNQDIRARAAIDKREQIDEVPKTFADYVANQVIGPDTLAVWIDPTGRQANGAVRARRKTSDYPSIDWFARSDVPRTDPRAFFPYSTAAANPAMSMLDQFLPTTPWLASTEPTYLDFNRAGPSDTNTPPRTYLDSRDWAQISNFAPDGRFVNLKNLRNNFGATHDQMTGFASGSEGPSLLEADGSPSRSTDFGTAFDKAFPAYFTARQRGAFKPVGYNIGNISPSDGTYALNQWADADGDGMLDSRWFELVDGRDGTSLSSLLGADNGNYRYFFAARAIDLSGLVNVNTAGDTAAAPTGTAPWGVSPTDVDLRRLLTMYDSYDNFNTPGGYDALFTKTNETDYSGTYASDTPYDRQNAYFAGTGAYAALRLAIASGTTPPKVASLGGPGAVFLADFNPASTTVNTGLYSLFVGLGDPNNASDIAKWQVWDFATPAGSFAIADHLGAERRFSMYRDIGASVDGVVRIDASNYQARARFGLDSLQELLTYRAINNPDVTSPLEATLSGRDGSNLTNYPSALPGSGRLSPLRSNRGLNDELPRYSIIANNNADFVRTQLLFSSDVRQRLTTISGGRQFRSIAGVDPKFLQDAELKIDARAILSGTSPDATQLFRGFADALALDSDHANAWINHGTGGTFPQFDTLFYGYRGPEAALHIAAHMAVNLKDMSDTDTDPSVYALVTEQAAAKTIISNDTSSNPTTGQTLNNGVYGYRPDPATGADIPNANNMTLTVGTGAPPRLATATGQLDSAPVTKVYGIEPQPFVTAVASFTVYYDSPPAPSASGDMDGDTSNPPMGEKQITIKGNIDDANTDFLYRVVAFQLTNPFDQDIPLSSGIQGDLTSGPGEISQYYNYNITSGGVNVSIDRDPSFYYIQYKDATFKAVAMTQPQLTDAATTNTLRSQGRPAQAAGGATDVGKYVNDSSSNAGDEIVTLKPIVIPAGKTVVLCSMSRELPSRLYQRLKAIGGNVLGRVTNTSTDLKPLIERAMGGGDPDVSVYLIPRVDSMWRLKLGSSNANDNSLFGAGNAPVNLYRTVREGVNASNQPSGDAVRNLPRAIPASRNFWDGVVSPANTPDPMTAYAPNDPANDQLVDRLIPPSTFNIDRKLNDGQNAILGTSSADNDTSGQDGFTILLATAATRPGSAAGTLPPGALPGYCIQPKYVDGWNATQDDGHGANGSVTLLRANFNVGGNPIAGFRGGSRSFAEFRAAMASTDPSIRTQPYPKIRSTADERSMIANYPQVGDGNHRPNPQIAETAAAMLNENLPVVFASKPGAGLTAFRSGLPAADQASTLRLADLLLPLGLGPEYTPYKPTGSTKYNLTIPAEAKVAWTTLSEALASAMGYEVLTPPSMTERPDPTFFFAPRQTAGQTTLIFDRGNLRTDDYVPFVDTDMNGQFSPSGDYRTGLEMPLAYNVFDVFTATPATQARDRAIPGLINVNTAPLAVLRLIPGLAPLPYGTTFMDPTNRPYWWRESVTGSMEKPPVGLVDTTTPGSVPDIASTVAAYRDKGTIWRRRGSTVGAPGAYSSAGSAGFVTFKDSTPRVDYSLRSGANSYASLTGRTDMNEVGWTRGTAGVPTRLSGMSELPGMRSVGELLAARNWDPTNATLKGQPFNIDFMAYDGTLPAGQLNAATGFETGAPTDPAAFAAYAAKAKPVSTRERLAMANVAMNSLSTRSDYFAVWFMVNGYKKADVSGLGNNDPMIPSIQRRFLMVVDRSNVTKSGDKPKVLLFKELPVTEQYPKAGN